MSLDDAPVTDVAATDGRPSRRWPPWPASLAGALRPRVASCGGTGAGRAIPVLSIGALLIALQPPGAKQFVVDLFGTNDKAVLSVAMVIGALVLSAGIGIVARRSLVGRPRRLRRRWACGALLATLLRPAGRPAPGDRGCGGGRRAVSTSSLRLAARGWPRPTAGVAQMPDFERRRFLGPSIGVGARRRPAGWSAACSLNQRASAAADVPPIPSPSGPAAPLPAGSELAVAGITPLVVPEPQTSTGSTPAC